jgi:Uma2 family endonuclease
MSRSNIAAQILDMPNAPLVLQEVQKALDAERALRQHFYDTVTEDQKAEFINGEIIVHSPVQKRHDDASGNLYILLKAFVTKHQLGYVGHEKVMIALTRNDYEPDICFFQQAQAQDFDEDQTRFPAPNLAVEVLSPGTKDKDRGVKMEDYQAHGILEYWIVDARKQEIEKYLLVDGEYELIGTFTLKQTIESTAAQGFSIPVKAVFDQAVFLETLARLLN